MVGNIPTNAISNDVIKYLDSLFTQFGYNPERVINDGDPLYTSRYVNSFCIKNEIGHDFSSAKYPQSNGQPERTIQHIKNLLRKCVQDGSDFNKALLMYYNIPLECNLNIPAMLLFNRKLRTNLPCLNLITGSDIENRVKLES